LVPITSVPPGISIEFASGIEVKGRNTRSKRNKVRRFTVLSVPKSGEILEWAIHNYPVIKLTTPVAPF
jgi:hypothetical protein